MEFKVGMTCGGCKTAVSNIMSKTPGVSSVSYGSTGFVGSNEALTLLCFDFPALFRAVLVRRRQIAAAGDGYDHQGRRRRSPQQVVDGGQEGGEPALREERQELRHRYGCPSRSRVSRPLMRDHATAL